MKRAIIVHCWSGYPDYCWYRQTQKELEAIGFQVSVPAMPETDAPKLSLWLPKLKETVETPDMNTYLIGHSIGCAAILRYLESLGGEEKIGGAVLVAGFSEKLSGFPEIDNFFETPFDFSKLRSKCGHFVAIHSDDDPYVPLRFGDIFREKLGAELTVKHAMKHFSGPADKEESCTSLPDVSEAIQRLIAAK